MFINTYILNQNSGYINVSILLQFITFLFSVILISLSGVMSPGPLTALTIVKGYKEKNAGILISLGHAAIEIPLIFLLYFGFTKYFSSEIFKTIVSLIGGVVLFWFGLSMVKEKDFHISETKNLPYNSFFAGMITTSSNPYFFLWWATIGVGLVSTSATFGFLGVIIFTIVHWLCDFVWYTFLSNLVFTTKKIINRFNLILKFCGFILIVYGIWFLISGIKVF